MATSGHSGVDRIINNLVPALAAHGHPVDLLQVDGHGPYLKHVPANVSVIRLETSHAYSSLWPLVKYLRSKRPAAILSDKDRVNRVALLAAKIAGVPLRVAVRTGTTVTRDLQARGTVNRLMHFVSMRYLYRWADAIIVPSHGAAVDLAGFAGVSLQRIRVLPSPVVRADLLRLAAEPVDHPWFADAGPPVVLGVGELCLRKDFATLLRAFAKVQRQSPCRLLILGEGRQRQALLELARELEIDQSVALPGFIVNPFAYMAKAALFVLASTCEGSPVALMEALGVGVPVVATDCPSGPREVLANGRYGRLAPVGDADALADAMLATLAEPPDRTFLQEAARAYTVQASAEKYLQALLGP